MVHEKGWKGIFGLEVMKDGDAEDSDTWLEIYSVPDSWKTLQISCDCICMRIDVCV